MPNLLSSPRRINLLHMRKGYETLHHNLGPAHSNTIPDPYLTPLALIPTLHFLTVLWARHWATINNRVVDLDPTEPEPTLR